MEVTSYIMHRYPDDSVLVKSRNARVYVEKTAEGTIHIVFVRLITDPEELLNIQQRFKDNPVQPLQALIRGRILVTELFLGEAAAIGLFTALGVCKGLGKDGDTIFKY